MITAKRRRRSLSVRQKLYCISALGVAFQVIVAVVALLSLREVNSAAAATDRVVLAQRQLQDADMAHDALRGDVSAAVLAGDGATGLSLAGLADAVRVDAASMRDDIARTAALGLNASVDAPVRELRRTADAYAEDATRIVDLAATDHDAAVARVRAFESSYATLSTGFAATREAIGAHAERAAGHAAQARFRARLTIVLASLAALLGMFVFAGMIGRSLVRKLDALADVAHRVMGGDREARYLVQREDEIGELGRAFNAMADDLTSVVAQLERDAQRDGFGTQLVEALEMADEEASAHEVIERAMVQIDDAAPTELLLSDSSRAHLSRAAESPTAGAAGCPVSSPFSCVAVRRGNDALRLALDDALGRAIADGSLGAAWSREMAWLPFPLEA